MKLIELVAANILVWSKDDYAIAQDADGTCYGYASEPSELANTWTGTLTTTVFKGEVCTDYATTYVTQADLDVYLAHRDQPPAGALTVAGIEHTTDAPPLPDDLVPPVSLDIVQAGARLAEIAALLQSLKTERDAIGAIATAAGFTFDGAEYARPLRTLAEVKAGMIVDMVNPRIDSDPARVIVSWIYEGKIGYVYPDGDEYNVLFDDEGVSLFARPN